MQTVFQFVKYVRKYMEFKLTLKEQDVNKVVNALASLPYRDSFELITTITKQIQDQMLAAKQVEFKAD